MLASCTHHAPSALGVLGRGDGSCRSEPNAQWCARARARDGHPNGHPGARGFASVYPRRRGSDARTRVGPRSVLPTRKCSFPDCTAFSYRGSNLGYAETHPPSGSQLDTKRLTRVPTAAPPATRTRPTPPNTRTGSAGGIRRLCQTAAVSLWRALSPECLPPSAHPGARPRVSEARSEAHVTFASSSPHLPRVIWIEIRGMRGAASPRRQRLCRRR